MENMIRDLKIALADARRCLDLSEATSNGKLPEYSYEEILEQIERDFPTCKTCGKTVKLNRKWCFSCLEKTLSKEVKDKIRGEVNVR